MPTKPQTPPDAMSNLDKSLGISRVECEHGFDACPDCDAPDAGMEGLVERVAEAIYDAVPPCRDPAPYAELFPMTKEKFLAQARAAIAVTQADSDKRIAELEAAGRDLLSFIEHISGVTGYPSDANASEEYNDKLDRARAALKGSSNHG